jgi:hypothetical protein
LPHLEIKEVEKINGRRSKFKLQIKYAKAGRKGRF